MAGYVGPMASFKKPKGWKPHIKKEDVTNSDGSINYPELVKRVNEYGRELHEIYNRFQR